MSPAFKRPINLMNYERNNYNFQNNNPGPCEYYNNTKSPHTERNKRKMYSAFRS